MAMTEIWLGYQITQAKTVIWSFAIGLPVAIGLVFCGAMGWI